MYVLFSITVYSAIISLQLLKYQIMGGSNVVFDTLIYSAK